MEHAQSYLVRQYIHYDFRRVEVMAFSYNFKHTIYERSNVIMENDQSYLVRQYIHYNF
jgi:hypothetical protein